MNKENPSISFSKAKSLMFWLPRTDSGTHIAINWEENKRPDIYINGHLQDLDKLGNMEVDGIYEDDY